MDPVEKLLNLDTSQMNDTEHAKYQACLEAIKEFKKVCQAVIDDCNEIIENCKDHKNCPAYLNAKDFIEDFKLELDEHEGYLYPKMDKAIMRYKMFLTHNFWLDPCDTKNKYYMERDEFFRFPRAHAIKDLAMKVLCIKDKKECGSLV